MKPNVKSFKFMIAIGLILVSIAILIFSRNYLIDAILNERSFSLVDNLRYVTIAMLGLAGMFWYWSSHPKAKVGMLAIAALISAFASFPLYAVAYVIIVLLPIYSLT